MVHGKSAEECDQTLAAIAEKTGIRDHDALYSTRNTRRYGSATSPSMKRRGNGNTLVTYELCAGLGYLSVTRGDGHGLAN